MKITVHESPDGIYVARDTDGRIVGSFYRYEDEPGWWATFPTHGRDRLLFVPHGTPHEVARRLSWNRR